MKTKIPDPTQIVVHDLKALLHWASVGVSLSCGGNYATDIVNIIESYSKFLRFTPPTKTRFRGRDKVKP